MSRCKLDAEPCRRLRQLRTVAKDARLYRRTWAMLKVGCGRSAAAVARMLGVSRQSVYNWVEALAQQPDAAGAGRRVLVGAAGRGGRSSRAVAAAAWLFASGPRLRRHVVDRAAAA